jgi:energy-coupling factor transport system permease protein
MSFLLAPLLANPVWRFLLVALLVLLTLLAMIPFRVWRQQMVWLLMLSCFVFLLTAIAPDGLDAEHQPRLPANELAFAQQSTAPAPAPRSAWFDPRAWLPGAENQASGDRLANPPALAQSLPQPTAYNYVLLKQKPFLVTRRSLDLGVRVSTLLFTLIYSTNLFLLTTAPEEITAGLESLMRPLRRLNWPVTEIVLTLTLSLRFIPLVLEEVQNLIRSVRTRAINWKKLGFRGAIQVWMLIAERLLENLLLRAEQIASAMKVRGFTSPSQHRVQWHQLRLGLGDWLALLALVSLWGARFLWGSEIS